MLWCNKIYRLNRNYHSVRIIGIDYHLGVAQAASLV